MPIPTSKKELKETLVREYKNLWEELLSVPSQKTREKTLEGEISVCDIVAYQIGWGQLLINWYEAGKKGKIPVLPAEGFKWNKLGELAKHFYNTFENESYESLLKKFEGVVKQIEQMIDENTDKQLYTLSTYNWTGDKWVLGRWINVNTSSPYKSARAKIRKWKKDR